MKILGILGRVGQGIISTKLKGAKNAAIESVGTADGKLDPYHLIGNIGSWVILALILIAVIMGELDPKFALKVINKIMTINILGG